MKITKLFLENTQKAGKVAPVSDQLVYDIVRELVDEIEQLKRQIGPGQPSQQNLKNTYKF